MGDFMSRIKLEKEEAKEYLVSRGWVETKYSSGITSWSHSKLSKEDVLFNQAWDLQYKEDEKMDKLRRPV